MWPERVGPLTFIDQPAQMVGCRRLVDATTGPRCRRHKPRALVDRVAETGRAEMSKALQIQLVASDRISQWRVMSAPCLSGLPSHAVRRGWDLRRNAAAFRLLRLAGTDAKPRAQGDCK